MVIVYIMDFADLINSGKAITGKKCYIDTSLEGEIDLFILNNKNLEEIHFSDGKITRIHNIPKSINKIVISNNMLEEIPQLELRNLVYLEANGNRLQKVNLNEMVHLVSLYLNDNQIREISNLPSSLETLFINQNKLKELDLRNADSCINVSCTNNHSLNQIIGGKQVSNPNFNLIKDAHTQIMIGGGGPKKHNLTSENVEYTDVKQAVNEYYALKNRYEENKKEVIKKIMDGKGSKKERIRKVRNAEFKCINCGKDGGSVFAKMENNLTATCGNKQNPCRLDINILSSLSLSDNDILETQKEVDMAKQKIIQTKMNMLFGYTEKEKSIKEFEQYVNIIKSNNMIQSDLINNVNESYYDMQNDGKKTTIVSKKMQDVYSELAEIRKIMKQYEIEQNKKLLEEIANKQKTINKILNVVRSIKYPICEMVQETVYNVVDDEGNFMDESKASKQDLNLLKQYPYNFDDFLNPNLEKLNVFNYVTKK